MIELRIVTPATLTSQVLELLGELESVTNIIVLRGVEFRPQGDVILCDVGIIAPLSTVPQIIQIYTTRSAEDLNLGTWGLFLAFTVFWLLYGIVNRARPLIITNSIWLVSYVVVIIGAVIHG